MKPEEIRAGIEAATAVANKHGGKPEYVHLMVVYAPGEPPLHEEHLCHAPDILRPLIIAEAYARSGFDISPCGMCSKLTVCIPDGLPVCDACGKREDHA